MSPVKMSVLWLGSLFRSITDVAGLNANLLKWKFKGTEENALSL